MEKLNRAKGAIKSAITRLETFVNDISDEEKDNKSILEVKLKKVEALQLKIEDIREGYYDIKDIPNLQEVETDMDASCDRLEVIEVSLKTLLSSIKTESNSTNVYKNETSNEMKPKVRLPEIPLPSFSGLYSEFTNFKTQFTTLIINNEHLDDSQRLYYLKAALKSEAKNLESPDDTFNSLFDALIHRYENKRLIIDSHISEILNFEKLQNDSAKELRRFIDCINKNIRALRVLEYDQNKLSEAIFVNVILCKIDKHSQTQFEQSLDSTNIPTFHCLMTFLEKRCVMLENIHRTSLSHVKSIKASNNRLNYPVNKSKALVVNSSNKGYFKPCILCSNEHSLYKCKDFHNLSVHKRKEFVSQNKLCDNCLRRHVGKCNSKFRCQICINGFHNTLLCENKKQDESQSNLSVIKSGSNKCTMISDSQTQMACESSPRKEVNLFANQVENKCVLLNTAMIFIQRDDGTKLKLRCLLDSASTLNLLTEKAAKLLGKRLFPAKGDIMGINCSTEKIKYKIRSTISNEDDSFSRNVEFSVIPRIIDNIPVTKLDISNLHIPFDIKLADANFNIPSKIDALIGSDLFYDILKSDQIRLAGEKCILQGTSFGFIVAGALPQVIQTSFCCFLQEDNLDNTLKKFFELESLPGDNKEFIKGQEEVFCEDHFLKTYKRDNTGRFTVQLPMKEDAKLVLGESQENAVKRLNSIWSRLDKNQTMANLYRDFMQEYEQLGHMKEISLENTKDISYFIPHHAVYKPEKTSTPLRVVFDASANTTSGYSLNSILLNGGNIQQDLFSIVTRFRTYKYAFCADIKKMYRQILVDPIHRNLQRIVWKVNKNAPLKIYELCTVTYGTVSAPFLAMRVLKALAEEEASSFPDAAEVLCRDMYMDDCLSGANTLREAQNLQLQLIQILERAGMELHKWVANDPELLQDITTSEYTFDEHSHQLPVKALGMLWKPQQDYFFFKINVDPRDAYSKREVLSQIARIYDPLGLIGPVLTKAKIFMQNLWQLKINWNEQLPSDSLKEWNQFLLKLIEINNVLIPRYVLNDEVQHLELHGFSDASGKAYGAAIYLRTFSTSGQFSSKLLCSKSRVAPIKPITIPRLELQAALLLSKLVKKLIPTLHLCFDKIYLWTDSSIVLSWIKSPPNRLKTFVANRVAEIQTLSDSCHWCHVSSKNNPADIVSRGTYPNELLNNDLWWYGPDFLLQELSAVQEIPVPIASDYDREFKQSLTLLTLKSDDFFNTLLLITNNFMKLIRILSYIFRFIDCARRKVPRVYMRHITTGELQFATEFLIKRAQQGKFACEFDSLLKGQNVASNSKLKGLDPFLDENLLIRVGGRLKNSKLPFDAKHQLILPSDHKLTKLVFEYFHKKYLHIGAQGLVHLIRTKYWPIKGKSIARQVVHNCVTCFKHKPKTLDQLMGNLPPERVTPNSTFLNSGADLCGPFLIKYKNQRKGNYSKIYVAIFICMATKAIHLEIVSDLSAAAFIAALKRFCSRRGKIHSITSDNATNFKGASSELNKFKKLLNSPNEELANFLANEFITWKFIPPRSPNFGGLWEAGVKSFKHHLHRSLGNNKITLEDFETLVIQIEGILNSRPLFPLSDDINEFEVLTPGHFLIGRPICSIPEPNIIDISDNRLSHWQRITKYVQCIWKRWSTDYLNHLQQRGKWYFTKENIKIGTLVLIKEENLPPCKWALARIIEVIPGKDHKIRTCKLKTAAGNFIRPISKLCLLPIRDNLN